MPVFVIDTIKPKNNGSFPVVEAIDVFVEGYTSLADAVTNFATIDIIDDINDALSGKANSSDVATATANLQGQIDQIVISASAESVVAPEVAASRVGENGTSYATLKARLDAENAELTSAVDTIASLDSNNILNEGTQIDGYYNGSRNPSSSYVYITPVHLANGVTYTISPKARMLYVEDAQGTQIDFVDNSNGIASYTATADGIAYVTFSSSLSELKMFNSNLSAADVAPYGHRTIYGNVSYPRLDAVETELEQTSDIADSISKSIQYFNPANIAGSARTGRNLFNPYSVVRGKYIDYTTGRELDNPLYCHSDFIEVEPDTYYSSGAQYHYVWFDENKEYISGSNSLLGAYSPSNAKYLVHNLYISAIDRFYIYQGQRGEFEKYQLYLDWISIDGKKVTAQDFAGGVIINYFDKSTAIDGQYVEATNGAISSNPSYWRSGYIEIEPETSYKISGTNRVAFYDENKVYITGYNEESTFTSPENAKYIIVCNTPLSTKDTFMLCKADQYPLSYESFGVYVNWLKQEKHRSKYEGKKMVCFGDSITNMGYTNVIAEDTGIIAINVGLSSGRYAYSDDSNQYVNAFAFHNIVDSIATGDWTIPDSIYGVPGWETQYARIQEIKAIDFTEIDFVSFAYGINDFASATPLDNESDKYDTNYFKGAMRYCIKKLLETYPHLKIIISTPFYRFWTSGGAVIDDVDTHTIGGFLLSDYNQAEIEVCNELHIPYVDNLTNSGVNSFNRLEYFAIADPLHPNAKGRAIIGHKIGNGIIGNY